MKSIYLLVLLSIFQYTLQAQQCWKSVAAGMEHAVAVRYDGTLWAWGFNGSGQLGDGTTIDKKVPVKIGDDSNWTEVSAGGNHTLAIKADGTLWAWGQNTWGQIGDGSYGSDKTSPVKIGTATDWKSISAGRTFSFAIKADGTLWSWGDNSYGQLGHDLTTFVPQQVGTATDWKYVSAGGSHTVALKTNNTLWACGQNIYGQLGNGSTAERSALIPVSTTNDWQYVVAGYDHTIAIKLKGGLWAWGNNNRGQLGNGTTSEARYPTQIGTSSWKAIAVGNQSSFAVNSNGTLWAWGSVIGVGGLNPEVKLSPEQLTDYSSWKSVTAGDDHAFAFQADETLWAWGDNTSGKLGDDTTNDQPVPQMLSTAKPVGEATQYICGLGTLTNLKVAGTDIKWYASASGGTPLLITLPLVNDTRYYASSTKYLCESSERLEVTVVINLTTTVAPTGSSLQSFCGPSTVSALTATGSNIKWYSSIQGGIALENTTQLVNGRHYYASQTVGNCESPRRLDVIATVNSTPPPVDLGDNIFCAGATIANLKVSGTAIKWYNANSDLPLPSTTVLVNGQSYFATQTIGEIESCSRLTIKPVVRPDTAPSGPATQEFCNAATTKDLITYSSYPVNWYRNAGGSDLLAPTTPIKNGSYFASQIVDGCESTNRLEVVVSISQTPAPAPTGQTNGSITGTETQSFCTGSTVASLKASGSNIKWYVVATGGTELLSSTQLVDGAHYYASQVINGCESQARLDVVVSVGPPSPPTGSGTQRFCLNAVVENLIATGTDIKWYSTAAGGSPLALSTTLVQGSHYYASQTTTGCESTSRLDVMVSIGTGSPIGNTAQAFCHDTTIANLVATGTSVQWYATASEGSPLAADTPLVNGNHYYASQTVNDCESQTRLDVVVSVGPSSPPTGSATQRFCSNAVVENLIATGTDIKWYSTAAGGSPLALSITLVQGSHYYASQTINGCESTSRLDVTVSIGTGSPVGSATQAFCHDATIANLVATGTSVQWYATGSGGSPLAADTPLMNGNHYYASQTVNGCESQTRLDVTATLGTKGPTGSSAQTFCYNAIVANLAVVGSSIKWYAEPTGGSPITAATKLVNGTHYFATQTVNGCESQARFEVTASVGVNTPTGPSSQSFCFNATVTDLVATGSYIKWYAAPAGGSPLSGSTRLMTGAHYYATQTINGCESQIRLDVTVAIGATSPAGASSQVLCNNATVADLVATGTSIKWYASATGGSPLTSSTKLVHGGHYFATQTVNGCESESRLNVTTTIGTLRPTAASIQTFCREATIADIAANGASIQWYENAVGGSPLHASTQLVNGTHYFGTQTVNGCESQSRIDVGVVINSVDPPAGEPVQALETGKTIGDLEVSGHNVKWYHTVEDAETGTGAISPTEIITNETYHATQTISGCESAPVAVTVSTVTGVESLEESFEIYPNPVAEVLVIKHAELIDNISVMNAVGKKLISKVVHKNVTEIDLRECESGVYYVEVTFKKFVLVKKIVKI